MFVLWLLVKKYPARIQMDLVHLDQKTLAKKFRGLNVLYASGFLLAAGLGAVFMEAVADWLLRSSFKKEEPVQFAIFISPIAFYFGGGFLGLGIFSRFIFTFIRKVKDEQSYTQFITYLQRKQNMNVERLNVHLGIAFIILGSGIYLLALNTYTLFGKEQIKYSSFWDLGSKSYPYEEIEKIICYDAFEAPNGNTVYREHYVIKFRDGQNWNSRNQGYDEEEKNDEVFDWLEETIHVEVDYQELNME